MSATSTALRIRLAAWEDAEGMRSLRRAVGWSVVNVERQLNDRAAVVFVAEHDRKIAGVVTLVLQHSDRELADGSTRAFISDLAVAPGWRRRGLGAALLARVEAEAQQRGFQIVTLTVDEDNDVARGFYARRGYALLKRVSFPWRPGFALLKRLPRESWDVPENVAGGG